MRALELAAEKKTVGKDKVSNNEQNKLLALDMTRITNGFIISHSIRTRTMVSAH